MYDVMHFSEAVESDGFLFCSGIIGVGADHKVPDDMEQEFEIAWASVISLLQEAGAQAGDIVETTTYHVGLQATLQTFGSVRDKYLSEPWPAWTAIGVSELAVPGARVEIRVTARLPS
jgi:enamine deaminase RidA (YjgF/YER057c/UK114 family)